MMVSLSVICNLLGTHISRHCFNRFIFLPIIMCCVMSDLGGGQFLMDGIDRFAASAQARRQRNVRCVRNLRQSLSLSRAATAASASTAAYA